MKGPAFYVRTRFETLRELRKQGVSAADAHSAIEATTNADIDQVAADASPDLGAIGDGTIIHAIVAFFQSPTGQAVIQALVKLLLGALIAKPADQKAA